MSHKGTAVTIKSDPFQSRTKVNPATQKGTKVTLRDPQVIQEEYIGGTTVARKLDGAGLPATGNRPPPPLSGKSVQPPGATMIRVLDKPGGQVIGGGVVGPKGDYQHAGGVVPMAAAGEEEETDLQAAFRQQSETTPTPADPTDPATVAFLNSMEIDKLRAELAAPTHARHLADKIVQQEAELAELRARLAARQSGEKTPSDTDPPEALPEAETEPNPGQDSFDGDTGDDGSKPLEGFQEKPADGLAPKPPIPPDHLT